jgi:hypothetical protein
VATFLEFLELHHVGKDRRLNYAVGNEPRLRQAVIEVLVHGVEDLQRINMTATGANDHQIWDELNQHPMITSRKNPALELGEKPSRLKPSSVPVYKHVVVRDAHRIANWEPLDGWLREMRMVKVCFESEWEDFERPMYGKSKYCPRRHPCFTPDAVLTEVRADGREIRHCKKCSDIRVLVVGRGRLVKCQIPRTEKQRDDAVLLLAKLAGTSKARAGRLLRLVNWRIGPALEVVKKIQYLDAEINSETLKEVAESMSASDATFEQALRRGDRATAASVAHEIPPAAVPYVIDRLDQWLGQVARAAPMVRAGRTRSDLIRALGLSYMDAERMMDDAGRFDQKRISTAVMALARADMAWSLEADAEALVGVMELLAVNW